MRCVGMWAAVLCTAASASPARAQPVEKANFSVSRLRPAIDGQGILDVEWAAIPARGRLDVVLLPSYANDPLIVTRNVDGTEERVGDLVGTRLDIDLMAAYAVLDFVQVGVGMRATPYQGRKGQIWGAAGDLDSLDSGMGDLRLSAKGRVLDADDAPVDLAMMVTTRVPMARRGGYLGETHATLEPELIVSRVLGHVRLSGNLGWVARRHVQFVNLRVDDEILYRLGAQYRFAAVGAAADVSLTGGFSAVRPFAREAETPLEILFGGSYAVARDAPFGDVSAFAGGGVGLTGAFGTPDFRFFVGARTAMQLPGVAASP